MNTLRPLLVQVFLRGGADGLSMVCPYDDLEYQGRRATTRLFPPTSPAPPTPPNAGNALPLAGNPTFGVPPALAPLKSLLESAAPETKFCFIHATGSIDPQRSHFKQQDIVERAETTASQVPSGSSSPLGNGWLGRYLQRATPIAPASPGPGAAMRGLGIRTVPAVSLRGGDKVTHLADPSAFSFPDPVRQDLLEIIYNAYPAVIPPDGDQQLMVDAVANDAALGDLFLGTGINFARSPSVTYPASPLARALKATADLVYDAGTKQTLEVVHLDMGGGWDTHSNQGVEPGGLMNGLMTDLAHSLASFHEDLVNQPGSLTDPDPSRAARPVCVLVVTEFGRTTDENSSRGTDHGRGGVAIAQGFGIDMAAHGRVFAPNWTGLPPVGSATNGDLDVETDIRDVQSEILLNVMGLPSAELPFVMHSHGAASTTNPSTPQAYRHDLPGLF